MNIDDLFDPGVLVRDREHDLVSLLRGHSLGRISIRSGAVRIGDAYDLASCKPIEVPAGEHEVPRTVESWICTRVRRWALIWTCARGRYYRPSPSTTSAHAEFGDG